MRGHVTFSSLFEDGEAEAKTTLTNPPSQGAGNKQEDQMRRTTRGATVGGGAASKVVVDWVHGLPRSLAEDGHGVSQKHVQNIFLLLQTMLFLHP